MVSVSFTQGLPPIMSLFGLALGQYCFITFCYQHTESRTEWLAFCCKANSTFENTSPKSMNFYMFLHITDFCWCWSRLSIMHIIFTILKVSYHHQVLCIEAINKLKNDTEWYQYLLLIWYFDLIEGGFGHKICQFHHCNFNYPPNAHSADEDINMF